MAVLEARDIDAGYGMRPIIRALSLRIETGSIVTLIGANGSGKSTIVKVMSRILTPSSGTVCLDGRTLSSYAGDELARRIAVLPQNPTPPEDVTVRELVEYGRFPHRRRWTGSLRRKDSSIVDAAIEEARLSAVRDRPLSRLSGGERQRAWIAMTLAQEPEVLLLDEPTTHLDIRFQFGILDLVQRMNRGFGITILMVLHDLNHAARYSHRIVAIKDGLIVKDGTAKDVLTVDTLRDVFGIESSIHTDGGVPYIIAMGESKIPRDGTPC